MRQEYIARQEQQNRNLDLSILRNEAQQQGQWRSAVQHDLRAQYRQTLMGELDAMINAPAPPPEPVVIQPDDDLGSPHIADENFNPGYWLQRPIFKR